jgi:GxxExxY protein
VDEYNELSGLIVDAAFNVHKNLGPGLLESIYEDALSYELKKRNLAFERQKALSVPYDTIVLDTQFRLDLVVQGKIVVELKCVERMIPLYEAQLLTHLKITGLKLGLLFNFNTPLIKDGIRRVIL